MLTTPHCKESLSRAYVTAVVGRARHKLNWNSEHDYGVDGYVRIIEKRGTDHYESGFGFDFQSKTTTKWVLEGEEIVYDLEAPAYNNLVSRAGTGALPFLLVLLCIPKDASTWLDVSADRLILQKCAYPRPTTPARRHNQAVSHAENDWALPTRQDRYRVPAQHRCHRTQKASRFRQEIRGGFRLSSSVLTFLRLKGPKRLEQREGCWVGGWKVMAGNESFGFGACVQPGGPGSCARAGRLL